ncbi:AP-4 complex subunit sigma-1 [Choanephora cucurbitarum]|uniref:AP complex subunit sigma n=1 Tax=Choanephora cucurbitarum TaxID=101091 RepID=A0A1C7NMG6_9FUNG|nr:AP-4 complex subunit sigma-1 [Choanephora cucurbitarum]
MIRFLLVVNKSCHTRFSRYYQEIDKDHTGFELEVARQCITRQPNQALFTFIYDHKIVYRIYASLCFIIGCDSEDNEFAMLELIQLCVECLDQSFEKVTELDFVFSLEKIHMIMDEIIVKGLVTETNQQRVLEAMHALIRDK